MADFGATEIAEGATRIEVAEAGYEMSDKLVAQGLDQIERGENQLEWAKSEQGEAKQMAVKGVADVAAGAEAIGASETLNAASRVVSKRAK